MMKFVKTILLTASLSALATSCGGDNSGANNPFNSKDQISKEAAQELIATWLNELDTSCYYLAQVNYSVDEHTPGFTGVKYYEAEYQGQYRSEYEYYHFVYKSGTLNPDKSNVTEQEVEASLTIGNGLSYVNNTFSSRYNYLYYYDGTNFSLFDYEKFEDGTGYIILTMDKRGLISYEEMYEADSQYYSKEIINATFTELH